MFKKVGIFILILLRTVYSVQGQGLDAGPGYQALLMNNPALSGSEGNSVLRLSYLNYYPGNNYNLNSLFLSYDSYFQRLHGGAGFYLSEDYLGGIVNDLRGGFSYAYFLQAGKNLFINAGLSGSLFHRGYNFNNAVLPDQIDPVGGVSFPSAEALADRGRTVFDVGAGFLVISGKLNGGLSVSHLAEPELSSSANSIERIRRKYTFHLSADLDLNSKGTLKIEPVILASQQGGYFTAGAGAAAETRYLAVNAVVYEDNGNNTNLQAGFAVKCSIVSVYYNYQFNVLAGNSFMPLSLLHQVGLAFSLNNVEKRKAIKTINFPKL
jgi:type IX secretion system PorP/SprF family membrane protein